ncbi:MAG TPA: alpha/beta hydrolase [Stellaceae bacterium]|nr:alpha/beta hydrolase [Stellaceae bacterium]
MSTAMFGRRNVVKMIAGAGVVGISGAGALWPGVAEAAAPAYDPAGKFDVDIREIPFRRNSAGRMLMARLYQPRGKGPFPAVIDLHGGAWNNKDRTAEQPMDHALAASGLLIVAIDMTLAPEAPYPACVQDANYAVRWVKANAAHWNGNAARLGVYGSSSGGHVAELLAMRPHDPRYNAIPLAGDARIAWIATRSPISDTVARYENAEQHHRDGMIKANKIFFNPWETIHESNPREILTRKEKITRVPFLIMQGALDDNMPPPAQENFAKLYQEAGGKCEFHLFEGAEHEWVAKEGPNTDKARATVKAYIAQQLKA